MMKRYVPIGTLPLAALAAVLAASSASAQYTTFRHINSLGMDDVAITPDGRYAVGRDTAIDTNGFVFDLAQQQLVYEVAANGASNSGPCNDAVEVTNDRAVVLGGPVQLIDLTLPTPARIAEFDMGRFPRDLAIAEGGRYAIVRGGDGSRGGSYVIDLQAGAIVLSHASEPREYFLQLGNDVAAASEFHGVTLGWDDGTGETDILVVEFSPAGGGGPRIVLDTQLQSGLSGAPMDVAISPDGMHAVVRSEDEVALVRLDGTNTQIIRTFSGFPAGTIPYGTTSFDTAVITDTTWATITLADPNVAGSYVNVQDIATGANWFAMVEGAARDLELTPDGNSLLVHTGRRVYHFDYAGLPAGGGPMTLQTSVPFPATESGLVAGLDSVVCTDDRAVVIAPNGGSMRVRVYDLIRGQAPVRVMGVPIDGIPIDVDITKDGSYAVATTQERYIVIDLRTLTVALDQAYTYAAPGYPWSDGVALHPDHAAAFGIRGNNFGGWIDLVDLVSREQLSCRSLPNSTGEVGALYATGSTRVASNDLTLHASSVAPNTLGLFFISSGTNNSPMGGGILCLGGTVLRNPVVATTAAGTASFAVDLTALPAVSVGSTWYTQFVHREPPAFGFFTYTNASSLLFE